MTPARSLYVFGQAVGLLSLSALLSCSNGLAPANDLGGTWAANFSVPGSSLVLTVAQADGHITGTGSYAIEAGRAGTLQFTGSYDRPRIALALHYDFGQNRLYSGTVTDDRHMSGILADSVGRGGAVTFTRR